VVLALGALAAGYVGWFRDSSLVAVNEVEVTGLSSPDEPRIVAALTEAAGSMTTLNFDEAELADAVVGFPTVVSVSADRDFPHGLAIHVNERPPALMAVAGGDAVPVAGDGTLLRGLELDEATREPLPVLDVGELPASGRLEGEALAQAVVLGATPRPLRPLVDDISIAGEDGVEVTMRGEIPILFGTHEQAGAKWAAAAAVLADPKLETLTYLDVRVPERPAVAGAAAPTAQAPPAAPLEPAATAVDPAL
jgi:cell division protein FtsQ